MAFECTINKRDEDNVIVCALKGSLDSQTYKNFSSQITKFIKQPLKAIILDLAQLEYISSLGLGAILDVANLTEKEGIEFALVSVPSSIEKVFRIVGAISFMHAFVSIEEVDKYLMKLQGNIKKD